MPKRPPKSWWSSCVKGVRSHGGAIDPRRVCGAAWSRKSRSEKKLLAKLAEQKRRHSSSSAGAAFETSATARRLRRLAAKYA
jgi:hypothetical protein